MAGPDISVVLPLFNEAESLEELYAQLKVVLDGTGRPHETIFIDDGSTDKSVDILKQVQDGDPSVRIIRFKRHYGKSASLSAGFEAARGGIIVTMDSDLQDDPADIPKFIEKLGEGYGLVVGFRDERMDSSSKVMVSRIFNAINNLVFGLSVHDANCGFKACLKEAIAAMQLEAGLHRYICAIVRYNGYRVGEVRVNHRERIHGRSKYSAGRILEGFADMLYVKASMLARKPPIFTIKADKDYTIMERS